MKGSIDWNNQTGEEVEAQYKAEFIEIYIEEKGKLGATLKRMRENHSTKYFTMRILNQWREDEDFEEEMKYAEEQIKDVYHTALINGVESGNPQLILHTTKTKLASRGFGDETNINISHGYNRISTEDAERVLRESENLLDRYGRKETDN